MGASARQRGGRPSYAEERKAARRAELAALCSLVTVLLWGACLIPLPAGELFICCTFNRFQGCSLPGLASSQTAATPHAACQCACSMCMASDVWVHGGCAKDSRARGRS